MNIMVKKGFLKREKIGMVNFYTPVPLKDTVKREIVSLVLDFFDCSLTDLAKIINEMKKTKGGTL